jgi:hypothetical protein
MSLLRVILYYLTEFSRFIGGVVSGMRDMRFDPLWPGSSAAIREAVIARDAVIAKEVYNT